VGHRARLFSRISPYAGPWGYRHWGRGRRGGGTCSPSPVSHAPDTLLLASPIPPGLQPAGYPCTSAGTPHPARACGAPPPPPPGRRGPCVAIPGGQPCPGCNRWEAVFGSSPGSPHVLDRGDIAIGGGGPRGGGTCSPSPVSHAPNTLLLVGIPTPPAPAALLPRPGRRGQCSRYLVESRIRGATGGPPCPALLQDLPMLWTVGISPLGEAARGAGELVPPPLSLTLQIPCSLPALSRPAFSRQATHTLRRHPHPFLHRDL